MERVRLNRRELLKVSAAVGGGLLIGFVLSRRDRPGFGGSADPAGPEPVMSASTPNAWLQIGSDDRVLIRVGSSEMGQGVMTALPMLVAEELDAAWESVSAEHAPAHPAFTNPLMGTQGTGGSSAVRGFWSLARKVGAVGRELLLRAAAESWGVDPHSCHTEPGLVIHAASGRRLPYGQLAAKAATLPLPDEVVLKDPARYRIIGKPIRRLDTPAKVDGSAIFGTDVKLEGLKTVVVARCPVFGGTLKRFDHTEALKVPGVLRVLPISSGVAVVADGFWPALQGRERLTIDWSEGPNARLSSAEISRRLAEAVDRGRPAARRGDVEAALRDASRRIEAIYEVPYLAHATMEPMNCTARIGRDGCDVWVPTQSQSWTQSTAARISGLPAERVRVHTTFLGGGFGRRGAIDFVVEAVELAKATGWPVKVMWTREDDMRHDFYRPATYNRLAGALDEAGLPVAWRHRIGGSSAQGAANLPYAIPSFEVTNAGVDTGVPTGSWRSVGSSQNAYITECFFDELARAGGRDPFALRRRLLRGRARHLGVLELAAVKAGWSETLPPGRHRGIALAESFGSFVAEVAEVSVERGRVRVHKVVCAVDCGTVVNPDTVAAQMEGGIVFGLTAALKGEIHIAAGRAVEGNFDGYPLLTMAEMPEVEVHIVPSTEHPGGVGEPGTPPIAPAVANAVFAATGRPVRRLPIRLDT